MARYLKRHECPSWLLSLAVILLSSAAEATESLHDVSSPADDSDIQLSVQQTRQMNLDLYRNYNITVDTATAPGNTYSSFSIQAHTQLYSTTLTNLSNYCQTASDPACAVTGSNVGLVQIWNEDMEKFPFRVRVECGQRTCSENSTVEVLLAVIGIPIEAPIPGGCTLTSDLLIDPNLVVNYTTYSTVVRYQDSDIGFAPSNQSYPTCDAPLLPGTNGPYPLQYLEYTVYQKCLGRGDVSVSSVMGAIEDMLTVRLTQEQENSYSTLQYNNPKKIQFSSTAGQGVVYNVIATDKRSGSKTAYVPAVTYACDFRTGSCHDDIAPLNAIVGVVLMIVGLFLCLVGHIFFHGEILAFHWIGGCFLAFTVISTATTSVDNNLLVGMSVLCGTIYALVWFLLWFLTAWHWFQVVVFGLYADFLITSSILYSPLEDTSVFAVLQISYVYYLTLFCGMILFMVPVVAFPRALSIWSSSLVGSYSFIFGVGMFTYTELSDIVLLVVRKLSISGFYTAHIDCPLMTTDYVLMAVWFMLLVAGVTVQTVVVQIRRTKHNRRQQTIGNVRFRTKFSSFPKPSLLRRLLRLKNKKCPEGEPLLTPSRLSRNYPRSPTSSARLPSNGRWSPSDSGAYHGNYGATGATTVNEPVYKQF